jgi:hypothetical protein
MSDASASPRLARRHVVLAIAALATLAASIWALDDEEAIELQRPAAAGQLLPTVARNASRTATEPTVAEPGGVLALPDRGAEWRVHRNLFAAHSVPVVVAPAASAVVTAPPPAASASPPPPPPLTLPYSFAGRLVTSAGPSVLLHDGAVTRVLALGDSLGEFRLEQDTGLQLDFIHVPSGERVVLALQP